MSTQLFPLPSLGNEYLSRYGLREHPLLQALRQKTQTYVYGNMQSLPEQALLLQFLARLVEAKRYLEVGVFTGYSLLAVALAMPDKGKIIGCDINADFVEIGREYWQKAGVAHKVELFLQPAIETLAKLSDSEPFDLVYIDADKRNYPFYYERALALTRSKGVIALDNTLLQGRVFTPSDKKSMSVAKIRELNAFIHQDARVEMLMLPLGDGLTLVQKK